MLPVVVSLQVRLLREGLATERTHVLALVDVGLHVHLEVELAAELLRAHFAREALDLAVLLLHIPTTREATRCCTVHKRIIGLSERKEYNIEGDDPPVCANKVPFDMLRQVRASTRKQAPRYTTANTCVYHNELPAVMDGISCSVLLFAYEAKRT